MKIKDVEVIRWEKDSPPEEWELEKRLEGENLDFYRWSNGAGFRYSPHRHSYHKILYVVRGSITFGFPEGGEKVTMEAGDRLELPPEISHNAQVGPRGVVCLEAKK